MNFAKIIHGELKSTLGFKKVTQKTEKRSLKNKSFPLKCRWNKNLTRRDHPVKIIKISIFHKYVILHLRYSVVSEFFDFIENHAYFVDTYYR